MYVGDLANACVYFMKKKTKHTLINIGTGRDYTINFYAKLIAKIILKNKIVKLKYNKSKPNGTLRKVMDVSLAKKYGWESTITLKDAINKTYQSFLSDKS